MTTGFQAGRVRATSSTAFNGVRWWATNSSPPRSRRLRSRIACATAARPLFESYRPSFPASLASALAMACLRLQLQRRNLPLPPSEIILVISATYAATGVARNLAAQWATWVSSLPLPKLGSLA